MKTSTAIVLGLCATAVICCSGVGFFGWRTYVGAVSADAEADHFADTVFPKLASHWDMSYVQNELSPEWKAQPQEIQDAYMKMMKSRLGALQSVDQFSAIQTSYRTENGNGITYVTVRAGARFEKAPGTVRMVVEKKDDKWLIFSMKIDSDVFDNTAPSTPKGTKV